MLVLSSSALSRAGESFCGARENAADQFAELRPISPARLALCLNQFGPDRALQATRHRVERRQPFVAERHPFGWMATSRNDVICATSHEIVCAS